MPDLLHLIEGQAHSCARLYWTSKIVLGDTFTKTKFYEKHVVAIISHCHRQPF